MAIQESIGIDKLFIVKDNSNSFLNIYFLDTFELDLSRVNITFSDRIVP